MLTIEIESKETHVDAEVVINTSLALLYLTRIDHHKINEKRSNR